MKKIIINFVLILLFFYSSHNAYAAHNYKKYDKKMTKFLNSASTELLHKKDQDGGYITAISITTQCGNKKPINVYSGTNGINDLTPINQNSIFQIGSITKSFVSIVILQLAEEHQFSIDDKTVIKKYFPEYPKWGNISLRQLMNMTSGIPGTGNNLPDDIFKKMTAKEYFGKLDPTQLLNLNYKLPLHFKPGTQFEYSNTNYILLGQFIKKITHHEPAFEIQKRIIEPLKLKNTYFISDKGDEIPNVNKKQLVHGYAFQSKKSKPYPFIPYGADTLPFSLSYNNTAGAMASTPQDINIYLHSIFDKAGLFFKYQKQLAEFVSRTTGKPIQAPSASNKQGFGLGIISFYWNETHPFIYVFNGATDGFNFAWILDPVNQIYFVIAINSKADMLGLDDALSLFDKIEKICSRTLK